MYLYCVDECLCVCGVHIHDIHAGEDRMFRCAAVPYVQSKKNTEKNRGKNEEEKRIKRTTQYDRHVLK